MKYIQRQTSPPFFEDWKKANDVETPEKAVFKKWDILLNPVKNDLRTHLLKEQGYLCCYCNQLIEAEPLDTISQRTKIEHLHPKDKEKYPEKKFTYGNLLVACKGGEKDKPVVQHCDAKKGGEEPTPIHPLQKNCEVFFEYNVFGEINGSTPEEIKTISVLGLDIAKLNLLRKKAIDTFIEEHLTKPDEEILTELQFLTTKVEDKFNPFCIAISQFIKNNYT